MSAGAAEVPWRTVTLDRDAIVRTDFPAARRGLDPEAVRAHLEAVADEAEALRAQAAASPPTAASAAGEQVSAIVAAAELSAAEIERAARDEAERVRAAAAAESHEHVATVRSAAAELRVRIAELEAGLAALADRVAEIVPAEDRVPTAEPQPAEPPPVAVAPVASEPTAPEPPPPASMPAAGGVSADSDGARLVALNMALSGSSREETDRYVAEHFDVPDRTALLDDVYASVAG